MKDPMKAAMIPMTMVSQIESAGDRVRRAAPVTSCLVECQLTWQVYRQPRPEIPRSRVRWRSVDAELVRVGPSLLPTSAGV
jgi:hypothetical protein